MTAEPSLGTAAGGGTDALRALARSLAPGVLRTTPPPLPTGTVRRRRALARLRDLPDARCVLVSAPAGYGKTTVLSTLADCDDRPCAWVTIGRSDDDPTALLAHVLLALDAAEPVPDEAFERLLLSDADVADVRLPRLGELLTGRRPTLLVLDDAHVLETPQACAVVRALVEHTAHGSCVAIGTRDSSRLGLARARAAGALLDVGVEHLTMSLHEGARLLHGAGLEVSGERAAALVDQTEGWPAALYLCALALGSEEQQGGLELHGSDRVVAEYLVEEVLANVDAAQLDFLLRTSVLDQLSGPLCDHVLGVRGSAATLDELARGNHLVVPMDRAGHWYRYHHLFQDLLSTELLRRRPEDVVGLHLRASQWFEEVGEPDEAIRHAHAGGDRARATGLIWRNGPFFIATARDDTVGRWLRPFPATEIASTPALAVVAAWSAFGSGDTAAVAAWLACLDDFASETLPSGAPVHTSIALLHALEGPDTEQMRADAALAFRDDVPDSPFRPVAALLDGVAARLLGDREAARQAFDRALPLGELLTPSVAMHALAFMALLAADVERWDEAGSLSARSLRKVHEIHFGERPQTCIPYAVAALVAARTGDTLGAREHAKRAESLLLGLRGFGPWISAEVRLQLARVDVFLGEVDEARRALGVAERIVRDHPRLGSLPDRVAELRRVLDAADMPLGLSATPLTAAELRVLRYLPTHLSFAQIADELFVSRNTVKTQAISVYRKLEVSSRAAAVERARALGLVDA